MMGWKRDCKGISRQGWSHVTVNRLIAKIHTTGSVVCKTDSGRPKIACSEENSYCTEDLIQSKEDNPGTKISYRSCKCLLVSKSSV